MKSGLFVTLMVALLFVSEVRMQGYKGKSVALKMVQILAAQEF